MSARSATSHDVHNAPHEQLQRAYVRRRRAWAKKVGAPFPKSKDWPEPDPGVIDAQDAELG